MRSRQLELDISQHGGRRRGSGRKKTLIGQINHLCRPRVSSRVPVGITLKIQPRMPSLRAPKTLREMSRIFSRSARVGLRVVHFALLSNHLHLIAEAENNSALSRGMKSLTAMLARLLNRVRISKGRIFLGRYHLHLLKTPAEVRNALRYVLFNFSKHLGVERVIDRYSSAGQFTNLRELVSEAEWGRLMPYMGRMDVIVSEARSWLLREGWRRACSS